MPILHDPLWESQPPGGDPVIEQTAEGMLEELDQRGETAVIVTFGSDGEPQAAVAAPGDTEAREAARKAIEALSRFSEDRNDSAE